jgi:hypothetical protein
MGVLYADRQPQAANSKTQDNAGLEAKAGVVGRLCPPTPFRIPTAATMMWPMPLPVRPRSPNSAVTIQAWLGSGDDDDSDAPTANIPALPRFTSAATGYPINGIRQYFMPLRSQRHGAVRLRADGDLRDLPLIDRKRGLAKLIGKAKRRARHARQTNCISQKLESAQSAWRSQRGRAG